MGASPDGRDRPPGYALGRRQQCGRTGRHGQRGPRIAEPNASFFHDLVDRLRNATQTAWVAITVC